MMDPEGEYMARLAESEPVQEDDDEASFFERVKRKMSGRVANLDPLEMDVIDPTDVAAYRREREGERSEADREAKEEAKAIQRQTERRRGK